ncbi:hypothetical protein ONS95_011904 [Cadophora gregata]|uniref:uncharacterized protein n=1 Tax=Cadophora gregata TaxID=51156 RepID=UPI0026DB2FE4|nr:uncharacterized protein ONS95_011904 [Cadophora gregata]KAK0117568.1 hypothetical protein ONS95_011904 [Cadophora gregata]KAK0122619.1 hypothetical protein ONS96_009659 [Cadophora gregata f. sp. sojae]
MPPKRANGSKSATKKVKIASSKTTLSKASRKSPRKHTKLKIGLTPKLIVKKLAQKKELQTRNHTPPRTRRQEAVARLKTVATVLDADGIADIKFDDHAESIAILEPPLHTLPNHAAKTEGDTRQFGQVMEPQQFKPGQIISVASHEEVYQDPKNKVKLQATREQTLTHLGWVYSKARKIVVISRFAQHVVGLPIFSHGGKGLEKKEKSEFVGIRDVQHFKSTPTDSVHPSLLSHRIEPFTQVNKSHWSVINGDSYVQFTRPMSFAYNTRCTVEGHLQDQDLNNLIFLANSKKPSFPANMATRAAPKERLKASGG